LYITSSEIALQGRIYANEKLKDFSKKGLALKGLTNQFLAAMEKYFRSLIREERVIVMLNNHQINDKQTVIDIHNSS